MKESTKPVFPAFLLVFAHAPANLFLSRHEKQNTKILTTSTQNKSKHKTQKLLNEFANRSPLKALN